MKLNALLPRPPYPLSVTTPEAFRMRDTFDLPCTTQVMLENIITKMYSKISIDASDIIFWNGCLGMKSENLNLPFELQTVEGFIVVENPVTKEVNVLSQPRIYAAYKPSHLLLITCM